MEAAWSRWLVGAWAIAAVAWLAVATLLLVQTWPQPPVAGDEQMLFGAGDEGPLISRVIKGHTNVQVSRAERRHFAKFLLYAVMPPGFLFAVVWAALWVAGLPFPSFRRMRRDKLSDSG
jgi:hypothetical protein